MFVLYSKKKRQKPRTSGQRSTDKVQRKKKKNLPMCVASEGKRENAGQTTQRNK
jgi:hypothetical protein